MDGHLRVVVDELQDSTLYGHRPSCLEPPSRSSRASTRKACWCIGALIAVAAATWLPTRANATPLPPNILHLEDNYDALNGITEHEFDVILDDLEDLLEPLVANHGATLFIDRMWSSPTVNAYAYRVGNQWAIEMHGGLARRHEVTPDGFALVVCHEAGHHLGGFPFKGQRWAATEGQSDYYATHVCARLLWADEPGINATYRNIAPASVRGQCDADWATAAEQNLCYRIAMAGLSLANLLAGGAGNVDFDTPDNTRVDATLQSHPHPQCRLDTYVAGALCTVTANEDVIPGAGAGVGQNSLYAEMEAAANSCHPASAWLETPEYNGADHPRCWFKNHLVGASPANLVERVFLRPHAF